MDMQPAADLVSVLIRKYFRDDGVASEDEVTPFLFMRIFLGFRFGVLAFLLPL